MLQLVIFPATSIQQANAMEDNIVFTPEGEHIYRDLQPFIVLLRCFGGVVYHQDHSWSARRYMHYVYCCVLLAIALFITGKTIMAAFYLMSPELGGRLATQLYVACIVPSLEF